MSEQGNAWRTEQAQQLGDIAHAIGPLSLQDIRIVQKRFAVRPGQRDYRPAQWAGSQYEQVASTLTELLASDMEAMGLPYEDRRRYHNTNVHGARVISKILRFAAPAYYQFAQTEGSMPELAELAGTLRASSDVMKPFAGTEINRCSIRETAFGITPLELNEPVHEEVPFLVQRTDGGGLEFVPSPYSMDKAEENIAIAEQAIPMAFNTGRKCLALGALLNVQWDRGITICMEGPSLFQLDFEQLAKGVTSSS